MVRCFEDDNVIHVDGNVDPLRDIEVISLELTLADLEQVDKRLQKVRRRACCGWWQRDIPRKRLLGLFLAQSSPGVSVRAD